MSTTKPDPSKACAEPRTVIEVFRHTAHKLDDVIALKYQNQVYSWRDYLDESTRVARSLLGLLHSLGIEPETHPRAVLRLTNTPRWMFIHTGLILAGLVPVDVGALYERSVPAILRDCSADLLFIDEWDDSLYGDAIRSDPNLRVVIVSQKKSLTEKETKALASKFAEFGDGRVQLYTTFLEKFAAGSGRKAELRRIGKATRPDDVCQIVFGENPAGGSDPKGYMYTHRNVTFVAAMVGLLIDVRHDVSVVTGSLSTHIHEQILNYYLPHRYGTCVTILPGAYLGEAPYESAKVAGVLSAIRQVRPSLLFASPTLWDHIATGARRALEGACDNFVLKRIQPWAQSTAARGVAMEDAGMSKPMGFGVARYAIFGKVAEALGLDRLRYGASVGAHLNRETAMFMRKCGIALHSTFGTPETCGIAALSIKGLWKIERDGVPLFRDVTVQVAHSTAEFLVTGPNVFAGYLNDQELTDTVVDPKTRTCSTGEVGTYSEGFVRENGHMRYHYVTGEGLRFDPRVIEAPLKEVRGVKHVLLVGDSLPYLTAIIVINRYEFFNRKRREDEEEDDLLTPNERKSVNQKLQREINVRVNGVFPKELNIIRFVVLLDHSVRKEELFSDSMRMQDRYRAFARFDEVINKIYGYCAEYEYEKESERDDDTKEGAALKRAAEKKRVEEDDRRKLKKEKSMFMDTSVLLGLKKERDADKGGKKDENDDDSGSDDDDVDVDREIEVEVERKGGDKKGKEDRSYEYSDEEEPTSSTSSEYDENVHGKVDKLKVEAKSNEKKKYKKSSSESETSDSSSESTSEKHKKKNKSEEEDDKSDKSDKSDKKLTLNVSPEVEADISKSSSEEEENDEDDDKKSKSKSKSSSSNDEDDD